MPYEKAHADWIISEATECFLCKEPFLRNEYREVHSTTGFHLMPGHNEQGWEVFVVTTIPDGLSWMKVLKYVGLVNEFRIDDKYKADAKAVHHHCHHDVGVIALYLSRKDPEFSGNAPMPKILNMVSHNYNHLRLKYAETLKLNKKKYPHKK